MAKFNEITFMVYDKLGIESDDARFTEEHIIFMLGIWRSQLLKQQYSDSKKSIPSSNYQTICVDLQDTVDCLNGRTVSSIKKIPNFVNIGEDNVNIIPVGDRFNNIRFTLTNEERFKYTGNNKWLQKIVYFTLAKDNILYLKSANPDFKYLKQVKVEALFDDPKAAAELSCEQTDACNWYESEFPLEESLVPMLVDIVYQKLKYDVYSPEDDVNNASDDLTRTGIRPNVQIRENRNQ